MEISISFLDIWKFVKRNLCKFIVVILAVAVAGGLLSIRSIPRTYSSASVVVVACALSDEDLPDYRNQYTGILNSRVSSGLTMVNGTNGQQMREDTARHLGIDAGKITSISALQLQGGPNIQIKTTTNDASLNAEISDAACEVLAQKLKAMFPSPQLTVTLVDHGQEASVASTKTAVVKGGVMSGALAFIVCFVFAILRVLLDRRVRNSQALAASSGISLLGYTEKKDAKKKGRYYAEQMRRIRAAALLRAGDCKTMLLAPVGSAETTVVADFAASLANCGKQVLLVNVTGITSQAQADILHAPAAQNVCDVLSGKVPLADAVAKTDVDGLFYLGSGGEQTPELGDLLASDAFARLMRDSGDVYDYVLLNCLPMPDLAQADTLASQCGAVVLLVRYGVTTYTAFQQAKERMETAGGKIIGFLTTDVE